jgi:hypothetical protein
VGISAGSAEVCADHKFPLRRTPVFGQRQSGAASHFFEFTGTKSPNEMEIHQGGEDWFCFAGLSRPMPEGGAVFTLLTTEPGPDVAPIHDRQMVILERTDWSAWLELTGNEPNSCDPCRLVPQRWHRSVSVALDWKPGWGLPDGSQKGGSRAA